MRRRAPPRDSAPVAWEARPPPPPPKASDWQIRRERTPASGSGRSEHAKRGSRGGRRRRLGYDAHSYDDSRAHYHEKKQLRNLTSEYETHIHFTKTLGLLEDLFEHFLGFEDIVGALPAGFRFLDLGCAPGGFSYFLLSDPRCIQGWGVTLPTEMGGYRILFEDPRFAVQEGDLMAIHPTETNGHSVNVCVADAQYLRDHISMNSKYLGRRAVIEDLGIWCLTTKELWIAFSKLAAGGLFVFRFGWTGVSGDEWYEICTYKMFALLLICFKEVQPFKSEFSHTADATFYVVCRNFDAAKSESLGCIEQLQQSFEFCLSCASLDEELLSKGFLPQVCVTEDLRARIAPMLSYVVRLTEVGQASQKWIKEREAERAAQADNQFVLVVSPVPSQLTSQKIAQVFGIYGRVLKVDGLVVDGKGDGGEDSQAETADTETHRSMEVTFNKQQFASSAAWDLNGRTLFGKVVTANVKGRPPPKNKDGHKETDWDSRGKQGGPGQQNRAGGQGRGRGAEGDNCTSWSPPKRKKEDDAQTTVFPVLPPPYLIAEHQLAKTDSSWTDADGSNVYSGGEVHHDSYLEAGYDAFATQHQIVAPPGFDTAEVYEWCSEPAFGNLNSASSVSAPPGFSSNEGSDFEFEPEPPEFDHCAKDSKGGRRRKDPRTVAMPEIDPQVAMELLRLRVDRTHRKRIEQMSQRKEKAAKAQAAKHPKSLSKQKVKEATSEPPPESLSAAELESDLERILRFLLVGLLSLVVCRVVLFMFSSYVTR
mmetsp:Transcript_12975/g.31267  ORF Transcript_12975/g.31267 Transcript_12975/m.31267 type:complete len:763 (+) Transcript_12975:56-2344(+)